MQPPPPSDADQAAWSSVPWTAVADPDTTNTGSITPIGWHKAGIPYLPLGQALTLQTLDVWIPTTSNTTTPPTPSSIPNPSGTWVLYIHGGAWRDPRIASTSFTPTATTLLRRLQQHQHHPPPTQKIAGLISLNYRLSPHPSFPENATSPSHTATHPAHITDVLTALSFLHRLHIRPQILTGHSCGATLAFQAVMAPARWGLSPHGFEFEKPRVVVGFNGLYDLAGFIADPPEGYEGLREGYREFVEGAFGAEEGVWRAVCPTTAGGGWVGEWEEGLVGGGGKGVEVVLVQSREDGLVPYGQLEGLRRVLEGEGVMVGVREAGGEHDAIWMEGERMAEVLWEVVERLAGSE